MSACIQDLQLALIAATAEASKASGEVARIAAELMRAMRAEASAKPSPQMIGGGHDAQPEEWLTVAQAAAVVNIPERTMYDLVRAGDVPSKRIGSRYRVPKSGLDAWLCKPEAQS